MELLPFLSSLAAAVAVLTVARPVTGLWDRFTAWWLRDLLLGMESLDIDRGQLTTALRWWGAALVVIPLILAVIFGLVVLALPVASLILFAPRYWLASVLENRRRQIRTQLAGAMIGLANTCRAGLPISNGLRTITFELPEPLRSEFAWIVMNQQSGRPLGDVLQESKQRLGLEAFTLFSATLQTTLKRGGRVTEMLDNLSVSIQDWDRLERLMDSATANHRKVIRILATFPALFLAVFLLIFPDGTWLLFSTIAGQSILLLTGGLVFLSIVWSRRILQFRL